MPTYSFTHEESGDTVEIYVPLTASDEARRQQVGPDGRVYKRVWAAPLAGRDMRRGDGTKGDFMRTTDGKNLKVGDMWEISKEMSQDRQQRHGGLDPVKEQYYARHERETGAKHQDVAKRERIEAFNRRQRLNDTGIRIKEAA